MHHKPELKHYGVAKRSGRYPWGSGKEPYQNTTDFLSRIDGLKKSGMSDTEISKTLGLTTTQFRAQKALAKNERRYEEVNRAKTLKGDGLSLRQIASKMGYKNDSSIRSLLNEESEIRMSEAKNTAEFLKKQIDEKGMLDVGAGVNYSLNISQERLNQALYILEREGYPVYGGGVPQVTNPGKQTNIKVIGPPGTEHKDIYNFDQINSVDNYISHDQGQSFTKGFEYPKSISSDRVNIRYKENGGDLKDGVVEIRRNVDDLSLGDSKYAQVRILVDDTKYIKGMAVYSDDIPPGYDIVFNTNKSNKVPKLDALKNITDDPDNPFGSLIKEHGGQSKYLDKDGNEQLSAINKRAEEGDWGSWKDKLPSQFLAKQNLDLINRQLKLDIADKQAEFDEINSLTNPTVKKALLKSYADGVDAAAVHLQAAALPGQKYQVILPINDLKDTEVYAPAYKDGQKVALVRYPHGGTFEIPLVTVNNKNSSAKKTIGTDSLDAVGINSNVANRLSGADFDGDTVMVIPISKNVKITSTAPLQGLIGFDPKLNYKIPDDDTTTRRMKNTELEMGKISNLITDMTLKGASVSELERAVKHSMVVIDAEKHGLDYKRSEIDNNISTLKKDYQGYVDPLTGATKGGASTLLSRAKSQTSVDRYHGNPNIDPLTGKTSYKEAFTSTQKVKELDTIVDYRTGLTTTRKRKTTQMEATDDPYLLSSGTPQEEAYAYYASSMKALGNAARKSMVNAGNTTYSPSANKTYAAEVSSLNAKLNVSLKNAPKERQAQTIANAEIKSKKEAFPDLTKSEISKISQQALTKARQTTNAKRTTIDITEKEWAAIQAGAISENKLSKIINNVDSDKLRQLATPRTTSTVTTSKANKINAMRQSGYTTSQIADAVGLSTSTVSKYLK